MLLCFKNLYDTNSKKSYGLHLLTKWLVSKGLANAAHYVAIHSGKQKIFA